MEADKAEEARRLLKEDLTLLAIEQLYLTTMFPRVRPPHECSPKPTEERGTTAPLADGHGRG